MRNNNRPNFACKALLLWIQSRPQFVGEVDFGEVVMDDTELTLFQEYFEEDQLHQDDYEETVGRRMDCDGGKISENDAFMHNDHKVNIGGPPVLANSLIHFLITSITKKYTTVVGSWPVAKFTARQLYFSTIHEIKKT